MRVLAFGIGSSYQVEAFSCFGVGLRFSRLRCQDWQPQSLWYLHITLDWLCANPVFSKSSCFPIQCIMFISLTWMDDLIGLGLLSFPLNKLLNVESKWNLVTLAGMKSTVGPTLWLWGQAEWVLKAVFFFFCAGYWSQGHFYHWATFPVLIFYFIIRSELLLVSLNCQG